MKPVKQTILRPPSGNCHAACLASILELPIDAVPQITGEDQSDEARNRRWSRLHATLEAMGLRMHSLERDENDKWPEVIGEWRPEGYWLATHEPEVGVVNHVTVWRGDRFVWNPYPGMGEEEPKGKLVIIEWFECLDPALMVRNISGRWKRAA